MTRNTQDFKKEILNFFKEMNSRSGHTLNTRALHHKYISSLNPKEKKIFTDAVNDLVQEGLVEEAEAMGMFTLRITDNGIERIYGGSASKSTVEIMEEILSIFGDGNADVGHVIGHRQLSTYVQNLNVIEQGRVEEAGKILVKEGYAELAESTIGQATFKLTAKGVNYIY